MSLTYRQAALIARSYFYRKRLAETLSEMAESLIEFVKEEKVHAIGGFRIDLTDQPSDPIQLTPIPHIDSHQLSLWEESESI